MTASWKTRFKEWVWSKLPDQCQIEGCCRKGMRGNENLIEVGDGVHIVICDYCSSRQMRGELLRVRW